MRTLLLVAAVAALPACGGNSGPPHWKDQPLETVSSTVDGTAYSIELPKGMQKSKDSEEFQYHADVGGEGYVFAPRLYIRKAKPQTLAAALAEEKQPILDKQETAAGWVYAIENDAYKGKEDYLLRGQNGELHCDGRVYGMKKGEPAKELIPLVEKMCLSLKAK